MIGDGLSHVGFGALAVACCANIAPLYFSLPVVVIAAFLLLRMNENGKIKGDAAIALLSTGSLAFGVMVMSMTGGMNVDVYNYMFGSILTMTNGDVAFSAVLSVSVIIIFILFYNEIFAVTFDENFAKATGTGTNIYNTLIAVLTAVTIVIGMKIVGTLLISSLIVFPSVISLRICKSYKSVVIVSAVTSVVGFFFGLILSIRFEAPTGASIVCVNVVLLAAFSVVGKILSAKAGSLLSKLRVPLSFAVFSLLAAAFFVLSLSGTQLNVEKEDISVVATNFASYDFARQIAGDKCEITMLLKPGEESHTYEPSVSDIRKIESCDLFIYGGGESDSWIDTMLQTLDENDITVIKMMEITGAVKEKITEGMQGEQEDEYDEHVWTSPKNAQKIAEAICNALKAKDSFNKDYYENNLKSYSSELKKVDEAFNELGEQSNGTYFIIADRFPFRYLFDDYNLKYYAAFPGCSAETQANPVTLAFLTEKVKSDGIPVIFSVDLSNGNVGKMICEQTNAKLKSLYSCQTVSLTDFEKGETYITLMLKNLENLKSALN